jgi:cytochrome subunit of sulfide dehydrogenase
MQPKFYLPFALALGLTAATSALAAPPAGQLLASQCAQCHGTNGNGPGFDKLSGSSAREISNELLEMKYRSVPEGIMGRQSHGYTDAQIQLIAAYLSGQRMTTPTAPSTTTPTTNTVSGSGKKKTQSSHD